MAATTTTASATPSKADVEAFMKARGITKTREGVSGADVYDRSSENESERERETFGAYLANGNPSQYLEDRNFDIGRRRSGWGR